MDSRVHPDLKTLFSTFPETILDENGLEETRKQMHQMAQNYIQPSDDLVAKSFHSIPGLQGAPAIPIVIYEPVSKDKMMSGVLWIHGGGYIIGGAEINDALCRRFVLETDSLVVSVDYRLAPEHPYPAPLEDCYSALKWFSENATTLGVDSNRIAVAGQSAGGGLTAALSLLARDRKGPKIAFQMPLYPMIDDRNITPSSYEITDARVWNRESNILGGKCIWGRTAIMIFLNMLLQLVLQIYQGFLPPILVLENWIFSVMKRLIMSQGFYVQVYQPSFIFIQEVTTVLKLLCLKLQLDNVLSRNMLKL